MNQVGFDPAGTVLFLVQAIASIFFAGRQYGTRIALGCAGCNYEFQILGLRPLSRSPRMPTGRGFVAGDCGWFG